MSFSFTAPKSGLLGLLVAASFPSLAQVTPTLRDVVVTANRTEQPIADVIADVSLIERDEIEKSGVSAIADLLARTPGIQFVRNGGPGATTSLMIRGADTRFTAVYVDGVRIDSQSTGGATWEAIPVSQIDHVEILRGPAAAIYGSDAVGGIIQIFTRKGEGGFKPFIGIGIGSYNTRKANAGFSGAEGGFDYSIGLSKEKSDGFNAKRNGNPDKDGYSSYSGNARLGLQIDPAHRLDVTALKSHIDSQYDSSAKLDDHSVHDLETLGLTWQAKWTDAFSTRAMATQGKDHYDTHPSLYVTETTLRNYVWQNEYRQGGHLATATLERREDELENSSTTPPSTKRAQNALALGYEFRAKQHTLQLNARHDADSEFGGKNTGGAAYAYNFTPAWKATVSAGTAFRAPTLYQRFSASGNAALVPETSRNQEIALRYASQGTAFGIVAYKNKINNLISYISGATGCADARGCYQSTKHAQLEGVTLSASTTIRSVKIGASFDWLDPKDKETGKDLIRRARESATLSVETPLARWTLGSEVQAYGKRFDNATNTTVLGGYSLINLYAARKIGKDYSLVARLDNLVDRDYQLANTYNTPGRSVFVGMRWEPQ